MSKKPIELPAGLADVALVDAKAAAATGSMSLSWWHAEVAAGRAPAPAVCRSRLTRWRLADVSAFWRNFGGRDKKTVADAVTAKAVMASVEASRKRKGEPVAKIDKEPAK